MSCLPKVFPHASQRISDRERFEDGTDGVGGGPDGVGGGLETLDDDDDDDDASSEVRIIMNVTGYNFQRSGLRCNFH